MTRLRARNQQIGQHAAPGTDLDDGAVGDVAQRVDDAPRRAGIDQEVLSEFRLSLWATAGAGFLRCGLSHVDPLSTAQLDSSVSTFASSSE